MWEIFFVTAAICLFALTCFSVISRSPFLLSLTSSNHLPPGPRGYPIVGNLLQFWKVRREGSLKPYLRSLASYGELTTLRMGSQLWVLINTNEAAHHIINQKTSITNERPHMPISAGLVSSNKRSVLQRTDTWIESRRMMRHLLHDPLSKAFSEWQNYESIQMLRNTLLNPTRWHLHQSRYTTAQMFGVIAGDSLDATDDDLAEYRRVTLEFLGSMYASVIDFFPVLAQLPLSWQLWRPKWTVIGDSHRLIFQKWWTMIKSRSEIKSDRLSWTHDVLLNPNTRFNGGEEEALFLANSVLSAGGDNTRMALHIFTLIILAFPEEFLRCRAEIDAICGTGAQRLPSLQDIPHLPYVSAFLKETLRWQPVVPLLPPHRSTQQIKYLGYVFPKNTNFVVNTVATCLDYKDPYKFLPERWMDGHQTNLTRRFWGFGGGRRICLGYNITQPVLFLAMSRLIYCFDFISKIPVDGFNLDPSLRLSPLSILVQKRSLLHEQLILEMAASTGPPNPQREAKGQQRINPTDCGDVPLVAR